MNDTKTTATGEIETYIFPITTEEVAARLNTAKGNITEPAGLERNRWRVASANRQSWFKIKEATVLLDLARAAGGTHGPADATPGSEAELVTLHACRLLWDICDGVAQAAEETRNAVAPYVAAEKLKDEMRAELVAMESQIAELSKRDVTILKGKRMRRKDEVSTLENLLQHGSWRFVAKEFRQGALERQCQNRNIQPPLDDMSEAGINARIADGKREIEAINDAERNQLTKEERGKLEDLRSQVMVTNAHLAQVPLHASALAAFDQMDEMFEAAMINAMGVVAAYRINCERLGTGRPNNG